MHVQHNLSERQDGDHRMAQARPPIPADCAQPWCSTLEQVCRAETASKPKLPSREQLVFLQEVDKLMVGNAFHYFRDDRQQ